VGCPSDRRRDDACSPACHGRWDWDPSPGPLLAGMLAESSEARDQSILSASARRWSSSRCSSFQTSARFQSRRRRQHVIPLPQPISLGSRSQPMPLFKTKMIPVETLRSSSRGRPPLGLGGSGGSSGAMIAHRSSLTRSLPCRQSITGFVKRSKCRWKSGSVVCLVVRMVVKKHRVRRPYKPFRCNSVWVGECRRLALLPADMFAACRWSMCFVGAGGRNWGQNTLNRYFPGTEERHSLASLP
jgi:hypothetical protein